MSVMEEEVGVHLRGCFFMELGFFFKKLGDKLGGVQMRSLKSEVGEVSA